MLGGGEEGEVRDALVPRVLEHLNVCCRLLERVEDGRGIAQLADLPGVDEVSSGRVGDDVGAVAGLSVGDCDVCAQDSPWQEETRGVVDWHDCDDYVPDAEVRAMISRPSVVLQHHHTQGGAAASRSRVDGQPPVDVDLGMLPEERSAGGGDHGKRQLLLRLVGWSCCDSLGEGGEAVERRRLEDLKVGRDGENRRIVDIHQRDGKASCERVYPTVLHSPVVLELHREVLLAERIPRPLERQVAAQEGRPRARSDHDLWLRAEQVDQLGAVGSSGAESEGDGLVGLECPGGSPVGRHVDHKQLVEGPTVLQDLQPVALEPAERRSPVVVQHNERELV
mmetsp:Transcript_28238/g.63917  ORF Transcript_28238/g.63917 Transcript_28238/m.63917 type:complete len:337 (-) Transcript_28238:815-1825(-)